MFQIFSIQIFKESLFIFSIDKKIIYVLNNNKNININSYNNNQTYNKHLIIILKITN